MNKLKTYYTQVFSSVRYKSKRRGDKIPSFTKNELIDWLICEGVENKWILYLESGMDKNMKPSIDRRDDYKGYTFDNMQLITWRENLIKGVNGMKHHVNSHNQNLRKKCFIWNKNGTLVKECEKYEDAATILDAHIVSVSRAVTGKRKTLKGYVLTNSDTFALTGKELEIKEG